MKLTVLVGKIALLFLLGQCVSDNVQRWDAGGLQFTVSVWCKNKWIFAHLALDIHNANKIWN